MSSSRSRRARLGDIDAVCLDAHGVLLLPDPEALRAGLADFGLAPSDDTCRLAYYEMGVLLDEPEVDYDRLNRSFAAALGVPTEHQQVAAAALRDVVLSTSWVPAAGTADAIARLVSSGLGIVVISNTSHGEIEGLLARVGVCEVGKSVGGVTAVLDSVKVGIRKPDPAIFRLALDELGTSPERTVHVGDSLRDDVDGALAVGMRAVHIDPLERCDRKDHDHAASVSAWVETIMTR